jgi:hypothetical protein
MPSEPGTYPGSPGPVEPRWYDDPRDPNRIWVWDGQEWTPHTRASQASWYITAVTVVVSALAVFVWLYAMLK